MNRIMFFALAVCVLSVLLTGCGRKATETDAELVYFNYNRSGMMTACIYSYAVRTEETTGETVVEYSLNNGYYEYTLPATPEFLNRLAYLAQKYELAGWDGFEKSSSLVSDGEGFSLRIRYSDGTEVYARGSNRFPEGYGEAAAEIDELFLGYLGENGIDPEGGLQ